MPILTIIVEQLVKKKTIFKLLAQLTSLFNDFDDFLIAY